MKKECLEYGMADQVKRCGEFELEGTVCWAQLSILGGGGEE